MGRGRGGHRHHPLLLLWFALASALCSAHPRRGPFSLLSLQRAKEERDPGESHVVYPEPACRRSRRLPASSQGFHGAQTRDQRRINGSQGGWQLPVCSWGVRRERAPRRTPAPHPFLPTATGADLSVFHPSITRKRLVRLRRKQTLTPEPRMKAPVGRPAEPWSRSSDLLFWNMTSSVTCLRPRSLFVS